MKINMKKGDRVRLVIRHFFIMIGVCLLASLGLYLAGRNPAISLHPNAYRDMIRSIVIVYILFFGASVAGTFLFNRITAGSNKERNTFNLKKCFKEITPYETIGIIFAAVTIVNSIMMLTGLDVPKQGVFAYVHLMVRLGIISVIVIFISFKEIKERLKKFGFKNLSPIDILCAPQKNAIISVSKTFTAIIILYCITIIAFQGILPASGGRSFYLSLLIIWGLISITMGIHTLFKGK